MSRNEVESLLGDPEEKDEDGVPGWETWTYSYIGIYVTFDEDAEWRCIQLSTEDPKFLIAGKVVVGRRLSELVGFSAGLELGRCVPTIDPDLGEMLEFPETDVQISFEAGLSDGFSWSSYIDEDDEFVWPDGTDAA